MAKNSKKADKCLKTLIKAIFSKNSPQGIKKQEIWSERLFWQTNYFLAYAVVYNL